MGFCMKLCSLLAFGLPILIGWVLSHEHPLGVLFRTTFQLRGIGKPQTEPVPDNLLPMPRPPGEIFFDLPGGDRMPGNGIGMCCRPSAYDPESVRRTVLWYLMQGGRHIDTASIYMNHEAIGLGMKDAIARGVPRSEIFLTTKVFSDNFGYNESIERVQRMPKELGVDYIDLVLMHVPVPLSVKPLAKFYFSKLTGTGGTIKLGSEPSIVELRKQTWRGLSTLREQGLIRNLGVSNFNVEQMQEIQGLNLAPIATNQMQYHPWAPEWQRKIAAYCQENKIVVTGYFSLGGYDQKEQAMEVAVLNDIAKAHGRRPAQILLRWSLQKGVAIIPGTGNHKHMKDNLDTYEFKLSDDDMAKLDGMSSLPLAESFFFLDL